MKALITGASSGIGYELAKALSKRGYDLILVARRKKRLEKLSQELNTKVEIYSYDLSSTFNCMKLYNKVKNENIDVLINNAGFGVFGEFSNTDMESELDLIDLNIKAVHILTKLFLRDFKNRNYGYILNVASSAGFLSGPLMASYYASKNYVLKLTTAINEELRVENSNVYIGALCPGPVDTEFNEVANVRFTVKSLSAFYVANYSIDKMFKRKMIIIPGFKIKLACFMARFISTRTLLKMTYKIQKKKGSN